MCWSSGTNSQTAQFIKLLKSAPPAAVSDKYIYNYNIHYSENESFCIICTFMFVCVLKYVLMLHFSFCRNVTCICTLYNVQWYCTFTQVEDLSTSTTLAQTKLHLCFYQFSHLKLKWGGPIPNLISSLPILENIPNSNQISANLMVKTVSY